MKRDYIGTWTDDRGISYEIFVEWWDDSPKVIGIPTQRGRRTKAYRETRERLGDDWVADLTDVWTRELPTELVEKIADLILPGWRERNPDPITWVAAYEHGLVDVKEWWERDRAFVGVWDTESEEYYAEWWDDDVRDLIEMGFFKSGRGFRRSVVEYLDYLNVPIPEPLRQRLLKILD